MEERRAWSRYLLLSLLRSVHFSLHHGSLRRWRAYELDVVLAGLLGYAAYRWVRARMAAARSEYSP